VLHAKLLWNPTAEQLKSKIEVAKLPDTPSVQNKLIHDAAIKLLWLPAAFYK
jgi:hypothetical protein